MRRLVLTLALLLAASPTLAAQKLSNLTVMTYSPGHGTQVEYYDSSNNTFLWYPGNHVVLPGQWKTKGADICFRYGPNTNNPVTGARGAVWECMPQSLSQSTVVETRKGDIFELSQRSRVPFSLPKRRMSLDVLAARLK